MNMLVERLIDQHGVDPPRIFYILLDFYGLEGYSILELVEAFMKVQGISFSGRIFFWMKSDSREISAFN